MKHKFVILVILLISLFFAVNSLAASTDKAPPLTKQIAAPPTELAARALPAPEAAGVRSQAAMIPIEFSQSDKGLWQWVAAVPVDGRERVSLMLLAPEGAVWQIAVQTPDSSKQHLNGSAAGVDYEPTTLGIGNTQYPGEVYTFAKPQNGLWTVEITTNEAPEKSGPTGYLVISGDSPYRLFTHLTTYDLLVGQTIGLAAQIVQADSDTGADLTDAIGEATLRLKTPDGLEEMLPMFDDGQHQDGKAGDGIYGAAFTANTAGDYMAQVIVQGTAPNGRVFMRTSEHLFPVLTQPLALTDKAVRSRYIDGTRRQLDVQADALEAEVGRLMAFAEVWGTDAAGKAIPVAWIGGIIAPEQQGLQMILPLTLDTRWLELAKAQPPYELRNVRVQDVDTAVPLSHIEKLPIDLDYKVGTQTVTHITDDMLMGVQPDAPAGPENSGVLMLIHGYCSGGSTWPTSHFSSYAVFSDLNQNRSHDQFAQLIGSYGNNFSSFGAVAHSQGGAASLHLYTYYWSGLDYSSGNRLIQSVGTPYQGTSLAGNLALLGEIFGIGCGTNWDLTYDGASLWLSNIPSWARSRVYYHTTSFKDVWWRWDYCHIGSDLLLDDPDDGTTEKWAGQLSGANNMGHKTNWCHTTGMRDTAQYYDASRNATMNANGNR